MSGVKTFYTVLGVESDASSAEIKKAYRKLASQFHPDKETGDHDKMAELQAAYDCLSDPTRRKEYDASGLDIGSVTIKTDALDVVTGLLDQALEAQYEDCLGYVEGRLLSNLADAHNGIQMAQKKQRWLMKRHGRFAKRKEGDNLIDRLIDKKLLRLADSITEQKRAVLVTEEALIFLRDYEALDPIERGQFIGGPGTIMQRLGGTRL